MNILKKPLRQDILTNVITSSHQGMTERERRLLFSFANEIGGMGSKEELQQIMEWKFKTLLGFSHMIIGAVNTEKDTFNIFLSTIQTAKNCHVKFLPSVGMEYEIDDVLTREVINTQELRLFDLNYLYQNGDLPVYLQSPSEAGIKYAAMIGLSYDSKTTGFWAIFFSQQNKPDKTRALLIKGFAGQIAVIIANLLSKEQTDVQITEAFNNDNTPERNKDLSANHQSLCGCTEIIGKSVELQETFRFVGLVAPSNTTVLICGETGTGKELIAKAIHNNSPRKDHPMVKVNCATLPANLIESELFGHERGSFTGAFERRIGKFELANNGTLFLDEIGELPLELQVKLLRVLQEREIERVGGKTTIKVNVRVITATNRDLENEVYEGRFRSDLYYRLNVFPINLAPLRDRRADIPLLVSHFIDLHSKKAGLKIKSISNWALNDLINYEWPGNIRELEHLIERSVLLAKGDKIDTIQLPTLKRNGNGASSSPSVSLKTIAENELDHIVSVLKYCKGRIAGSKGAADILGVPPTTLTSKIKRFGIQRSSFGTNQ